MEKIKREKGWTTPILKKQDEIIDWINKHEKDNRQTMQEAVRLMMEDMKNATKAKATHSTGTIT